MLKVENVEIDGWKAAIRGMRNPKNSWHLSDTDFSEDAIAFGEKDLKLMTILANAGTDHGKFLRMITVYLEITAPLYWWKEFDTYKVGTVANSCSTMHKIQAKEFEMQDFSTDHLSTASQMQMIQLISLLNQYRDIFNSTKDKNAWWQMIQLLPTSYNQKRTVMLNYAVLKNMYKSRKDHKLDEWHVLCDWIESLPLASELITGKDDNNV